MGTFSNASPDAIAFGTRFIGTMRTYKTRFPIKKAQWLTAYMSPIFYGNIIYRKNAMGTHVVFAITDSASSSIWTALQVAQLKADAQILREKAAQKMVAADNLYALAG